MKLIGLMVLAYLLGSIPFSYIFPKVKGKNVMAEGTRNVGASNAFVVGGPLAGILALLGDLAKGYLPVALAGFLLPGNFWAVALVGMCVIAGHDFSLFLGFKGGKGIATTAGVVLAFDPLFAVIAFLLWVLLVVVTRYFIPSTLIVLAALPIMMFILGYNFELVVFAVVAFSLALYTHRQDLVRFVSGKELQTGDALKHYL